MQMILILWALGLAVCDKLDRTYLPPPGSITAGGRSDDLNLPLEYPTETNPSTLDLDRGSDFLIAGDSLSSQYPNIALGIDRQGPPVISSNFFTNSPEITASKNNYNIPSSTTSYNLSDKLSLLPVETYNTTDKSPQSILMIDSRRPISNLPKKDIDGSSINFSDDNLQNKNLQELQQNPSRGIILKMKPENIQSISPELKQYIFSKTEYPKIQYPSDLVNTPDLTYSTENIRYPVFYNNQQTLGTDPPERSSNNYFGTANRDFQDYNNSDSFSTLAPVNSSIGVDIAEKSPTFSSIPASFKDDFNSNIQPQNTFTDGNKNAIILNYTNILTPDGFAFSFDTSNGIHADESGTADNGVKAQGSYSFFGDDGKLYRVEYTADEKGFLPRGDHLPTAPPIPNDILRGIEQAEKNKQLGIIDDGSYDDAKYGHKRYQGLMERVSQNKHNNSVVKQPEVKDKQPSGIISFDKYSPSKYGTISDELFPKYGFGATFDSPNMSKVFEVSKKYETKNDRDLLNGPNKPDGNNFLSDGIKNMKAINEPGNKFRGETFSSTFRPNENSAPYPTEKSGIYSPMDEFFNSRMDYNAMNLNQNFHPGYEYIQPQNKFNINAKSNLQSLLANMRNNPESNSDKKNSKISTIRTFSTPNVYFNNINREPDTNSQVSREKFNKYPIRPLGNINTIKMRNDMSPLTKSDILEFYNTESDQIRDVENIAPERTLTSLEPNYASSTIRPYNYQSLDSFNKNVKQYNKYPSSTIVSQYTISTTPLYSEISSSFTPSTSSYIYSPTTPTTSQVTSTIRPQVTSSRPTSSFTSRPSVYGGTEDFKISTIKSITPGETYTEKPDFEGQLNKIPETKGGFSENVKPGYGLTTDPRSQDLSGVSYQPQQFRNQASTERVIGEDFSGPNQAQRFDPQHGYYY